MKFAVIDFETTGDQPGDEAIQVGLVVIQDQEIIYRYSSFIRPSIPIPAYITMLTGISDDDVRNAPALEEVLLELVPHLQDSVFVAHHAAFDLSFLQRSLQQEGYLPFQGRILDTMDWVRMLYPSLGSLQLSMIARSLDISHDRPHQADSDAEATAQIWLACLHKLDELPLITLQRIAELFAASPHHSGDDIAWFAAAAADRRLQAGLVTDAKLYRQFALAAAEWTLEQPADRDETMEELLDEGFPAFAQRLRDTFRSRSEAYEERPAQEQMMNEVMEAFEQDRHLIVEAGTGTGKSLGYLIPALYYGMKTERKVVVSTHTITLQEQLRERDLPMLQSMLPVSFRSAVLKGRQHYLCLRKFEQKMNTVDYGASKEERVFAAQMLVWLGQTERGDDDDIHLGGRGYEWWSPVSSDTDSCLNRSCPWFKHCFYHRARHEAGIADVIVTNHSLLFADMKADNRLLPSYEHLILDEAHQVEEVAGKFLGFELHYFGYVHTLQRLLRDSKSGQLPQLAARLRAAPEGELQEKGSEWAEAAEKLYPALIRSKEHWDQLCDALYAIMAGPRTGEDAAEQPGGGSLVYRLKSDKLPNAWSFVKEREQELNAGFTETLKKLDKLLAEMKDDKDELDIQSLLTDLGGSIKDCMRNLESLRFFVQASDPNYVYWMETAPNFKGKSMQLSAVPIDISSILKERFFAPKESVVLTSATLSVESSFDYIIDQLGLTDAAAEGKVKTVKLPSPFKYREQALVVIPRDFPMVKGLSGEREFVERLIPSLFECAAATRGRMLVLFTSYRMLKQTYEPLKELLKPLGINVLGQGQEGAGRNKLIRMFQQHDKSVLLGTSSFWEGVDIPGEALTCLAIVRLPFSPPNHPIVEARSEYLRSKNKNPFMELSVPQAVIKFKQGFGRLVRTARDNGIVIIYDTRVLHTPYGKHFLYSLPGPRIEHMSSEQMTKRIENWLVEKEGGGI